ncbi:membrane-associated sensor domain-containing protein [Pantoea agglomerans]|uniref:membrane-associated sensor domain-containing protein n=1 Tax=Enterobacter agglomerans TaxID=549 RepID=UPI00057FF0E6|nr:membrane-associated sensor domain-containing protein [Pantoea agglomerans]KIC86550.1 hypothetical protein RN49_13090 [Pantoea agglomerans]SUB25410.1 Uncharacterised protein [Pantoea agglomerans]
MVQKPDRRRALNKDKVWQDHKDMVRQALSASLPWFAFVNVSFALIILFRHVLIRDFDRSIGAHTEILPLIDLTAGAIIALSLLLLLLAYRLPARLIPLSTALLLILGVMWSFMWNTDSTA